MNPSKGFATTPLAGEFEGAAQEFEILPPGAETEGEFGRRGGFARARPVQRRRLPPRPPMRPPWPRPRPRPPQRSVWPPSYGGYALPVAVDGAAALSGASDPLRCVQDCLSRAPAAGAPPDPSPGPANASPPEAPAGGGEGDASAAPAAEFEFIPELDGRGEFEGEYEGEYEGEFEGEYEGEGAFGAAPHASCCGCRRCRSSRGAGAEGEAFEIGSELLSEAEEMELAMELLAVSNEAEMEQFLGKLFKGIGRGLKKVGSFVGRKVLPALGGALKGLAKKALPFVGGALGSLIPIPGVGTAVGTALGGALSKALELELGELEADEAEFETARRIVRIAASAAQRAGAAEPGADPDATVRQALIAAARAHLPHLAAAHEAEFGAAGEAEGEGEYESVSGRWVRHGRHVVLHGV